MRGYSETRKRIASNIRYLRNLYEHTQREFSLKVGINYSYLAMLETGDRGGPIETLEKIASAFRLKVGDLVDRDLRKEAKRKLQKDKSI